MSGAESLAEMREAMTHFIADLEPKLSKLKDDTKELFARVADISFHIIKSTGVKTVRFGLKTSKHTMYIGLPIGIIAGGIAGGVLCTPAPNLYALVCGIFIGAAFGTAASMIFFGGVGLVGGGFVGGCYGFVKGTVDVFRGNYNHYLSKH